MLIGFDASRAFVAERTGTENYSLNLLQALAKIDRKNKQSLRPSGLKQGLRSSPASPDAGLKYRVYLRGNLDPKKIAQNFPKNFEFRLIRPSRLWTQVGLALETWRNPVDLLFVPAHTLPVLRNPKIKTVVTIHDLGVEFLPGYHQFPQRYYLDLASRYAARHADTIIAVSAATKRDLINRYKVAAEKVFVVSEGVERRVFRPQSEVKVESVKKKYKINGPYILFVGTVQPRKNLQVLIEAFADLVTNHLSLILAGKFGWDYDEILALPKKLGIAGRVKFLGHVPEVDLPALYSGAVVFALPSLFEGFGLPILEALSCDCPVVASDIAPHREIFQKLFTNYYSLITNSVPMTLVKPKNVEDWVSILYQYVSQYEKRSTSSTHKGLILDLLSWERAANATLQVFDKTLS